MAESDKCKTIEIYTDNVHINREEYICAVNKMLSIDTTRNGLYIYFLPSFSKEQFAYIDFSTRSIETATPTKDTIWTIMYNTIEIKNLLENTLNNKRSNYCDLMEAIETKKDTLHQIELDFIENNIQEMKSLHKECVSDSSRHFVFDGKTFVIVLRQQDRSKAIEFQEDTYNDMRYNQFIDWFKNHVFEE